MCGGEANVVANLVEMAELLAQFGVHDDFLRPGYGMTETCAAAMYGCDCPSYEVERGLEFSTVGNGISGIETRIMKDNNDQAIEIEEANINEIGNFQLSGSVVFSEYYNNPLATKNSFTRDGWFITGDKGFIDDHGYLNLTGTSRETIIINGVKYFPHEVETAIEESLITGATPSYTAVFPHRPSGSQTEELCVVYLPTFDLSDAKARTETATSISQVCIMIASVRTYRIIPLPKEQLPKSALDKLSRAKIRTAFEEGAYRGIEEENSRIIKAHRMTEQGPPATGLEESITRIFCEMFDVATEDAWVGSSLFDFGITSIELIAFKQRIQTKLTHSMRIPVVMLMNNPTIRGMAEVLSVISQGTRPYNPVVTLSNKGTKTPLWLIHPVTGEVLVFVGLIKYIIDRPLYALRARGFEKDEKVFSNLDEYTDSYYTHLKTTQPSGPYAIAGYSEGALVAYELSKRLEANGDKVAFCGNLDTTPKPSPTVMYSHTDALIHLSYIIELLSKEDALAVLEKLRKGTYEDAMTYILDVVPSGRLEELELDRAKLQKWCEVTYSLYDLIRNYQPSGKVQNLDVFFARNSGIVDQVSWMTDHLDLWREHSRTSVECYECDGNHHSMLTQENTPSFQRALKKALSARGL